MKKKMKTKKKFKARTGSPFSNKDAQKIGEELESIKSKGVLTTLSIVKRARNPKSVLYDYFEWSNTIAAEKFRLQQARNIVNHIIEVTVIEGNPVEERAYFSVVSEDKKNVYVSLTEAITVTSYKKQLFKEMESTLQNLLRLIRLFSSIA